MLPTELPEHTGPVAVDTETSGLYPDDGARVAVVSLAWRGPDDEIVSCAFPFAQQSEHPDGLPSYNLPRVQWVALLNWLRSRPGLIFHNADFDAIMMEVGTGTGWPGVDLLDLVVWDTMLINKMLDGEHKVGLGETMIRLFNDPGKVDLLKEIHSWLRKHHFNIHRYDQAPWELAEPYAAGDAEMTLRLARHQWYRIQDGEGRQHEANHDLEIMRTLVRMERRGLPYDYLASAEIAEKLAIRKAELRAALPFEPKLAPMREWFYTTHGFAPLKSTKGGQASLDAESIKYLAAQDAPGAETYLRWKQVGDAEVRWYRGFADRTNGLDGRLRPRFQQTSVRSGRLSVNRATLQMIPHDYILARSPDLSEYPSPRALIPDVPGHHIWEMDLSQAELRVAAWVANCPLMLERIRAGADLHGDLARQVWGTDTDDPDWDRLRQVAKRANFALIFGIGARALHRDLRAQGFKIDQHEVYHLVDTWHDLYPEIRWAINRYMTRTERTRMVQLVNGKRSAFQSWEHEHKAFNRRVQGSIGEFAKAWMVKADHLLMAELPDDPDNGLLLQIHDSLVCSMPIEREDELVAAVVEIGETLWTRWFRETLIDGDTGRRYLHTVPGKIEYKRWSTDG